jgi:hypothetical protein
MVPNVPEVPNVKSRGHEPMAWISENDLNVLNGLNDFNELKEF